ncbi:MAG: hypothetical protein ACWA6U_10385 [Breznakibacter sp.]
MKRLLIFLIVATIATSAFAQIKGNTLGIRLGGGNWFTFEASYQHAMASNQRIQADMGLLASGKTGFALSGSYHWVMPIESNFNFFVGPSVRIGAKHDDFLFGIAPQLGTEYWFTNAPFQLSVDFRPGLGVNHGTFFMWDVMFGMRYVFGK